MAKLGQEPKPSHSKSQALRCTSQSLLASSPAPTLQDSTHPLKPISRASLGKSSLISSPSPDHATIRCALSSGLTLLASHKSHHTAMICLYVSLPSWTQSSSRSRVGPSTHTPPPPPPQRAWHLCMCEGMGGLRAWAVLILFSLLTALDRGPAHR